MESPNTEQAVGMVQGFCFPTGRLQDCGLKFSSYGSDHHLCIRLFDLQMTENPIRVGLSREKELIDLGTAKCQARTNFNMP